MQDANTNTDHKMPNDYEPPAVTVLGDLHELTQGGLGTSTDGLGGSGATPTP